MVRAIVIPHDAGLPLRIQELPDVGAFQEAVDGYIEPKEIPKLDATLYVNAASFKRRLPFNSRASALWLFHNPGLSIEPAILGDAVVTGSGSGWDMSTDISFKLEQLLTGEVEFIVQCKVDDEPWRNTLVRFGNFFDTAIWCMLYSHFLWTGPQFRIAADSRGAEELDRRFESDPRW